MATAHQKGEVKRLRGIGGKFIGVEDPPLVDLQVANPVNYLKIWWAKIIGNEGIDVSLRIRPLTAITMAAVVGGMGFGIGRMTVPAPLVKYMPIFASATPSPTPNAWRETAYTGILRYSATLKKYYLEIGNGESVTLDVIPSLSLSKFISRRILVIGEIHDMTKMLKVNEATDIEILPASPVSIPTLPPTPTPGS